MIKLTQLLNEVLVKNKRTGNVYDVEKFNPAAHEKPKPADIKKITANTGTKKSDDKSGDYPVGSIRYRLQKNNPKDVVKYDNYLKATIKNIADLTDNNDHNGAVMVLAKMMDDKSSAAEMQKIQKYHNSKGHMPQSLIKYRSSILNNLLAQAKKTYGDKFVKQLQNSF
jgi:viroplasmin and RNaseH domain-containing protein